MSWPGLSCARLRSTERTKANLHEAEAAGEEGRRVGVDDVDEEGVRRVEPDLTLRVLKVRIGRIQACRHRRKAKTKPTSPSSRRGTQPCGGDRQRSGLLGGTLGWAIETKQKTTCDSAEPVAALVEVGAGVAGQVRSQTVADDVALQKSCFFGQKKLGNLSITDRHLGLIAISMGLRSIILGKTELFFLSLGFTYLEWVFLGFSRFIQLLRGFWRILLDFSEFYLVLLGFTGLHWVLVGITGFYWILLGFAGFNWV